jgi:hypothetical protein
MAWTVSIMNYLYSCNSENSSACQKYGLLINLPRFYKYTPPPYSRNKNIVFYCSKLLMNVGLNLLNIRAVSWMERRHTSLKVGVGGSIPQTVRYRCTLHWTYRICEFPWAVHFDRYYCWGLSWFSYVSPNLCSVIWNMPLWLHALICISSCRSYFAFISGVRTVAM